ncbi:adenylate kinase [Enterobacteriaceae bacterium 89]|nr:adenylate kinase [Enterobacteriaceae bacterium 89]
MRINVTGTSGSGKSTLARRLAVMLAVPYIELDTLYWRKNWQGASDEELFSLLKQKLSSAEGWILDGNYNRTRPVKWQDVQLIVWLDYGFWRTLRQAVGRAYSRARSRRELWAGTGNCESFRRSFFSRDSIILWTIKTWRQNRLRYLADMQDPQYAHLQFVRLCNPRETEAFLAKLHQQQRT